MSKWVYLFKNDFAKNSIGGSPMGIRIQLSRSTVKALHTHLQ